MNVRDVDYVPGPQTQWLRARAFVLARDRHRCRICGRIATHVDHIWPRALGGTSVPENLQALCGTCNITKGTTAPDGMLPLFVTGAPDHVETAQAERAEARQRAWSSLYECRIRRVRDADWSVALFPPVHRANNRANYWSHVARSHRHRAYAVEHGLAWVFDAAQAAKPVTRRSRPSPDGSTDTLVTPRRQSRNRDERT